MQKYSSTSQHSRKNVLERKHEQMLVRKIILISLVCIAIVVALVMYAIPLMVRVADMWGQVRNSNKNETSNRMAVPLYRPQFNQLGYEATNTATISISGSSEIGTSVTVTQNGEKLPPIVTDNSGIFTLSEVRLKEGNNTFVAMADDGKGRKSESTRSLSVVLDTSAPKIDVTTPESGANFSGNNQSVIEVKGTAEGADEIYINEERALLNGDGTFNHRFQLSEGENTITVYAKDQAGNKSIEVQRKVTFTP